MRLLGHFLLQFPIKCSKAREERFTEKKLTHALFFGCLQITDISVFTLRENVTRIICFLGVAGFSVKWQAHIINLSLVVTASLIHRLCVTLNILFVSK